MGVTRKRCSYKCVFKSQYSCCPSVWMYCCNRSLNIKINRLNERCLRMVYNDKNSTFDELLEKHGSAYIHHQNLQKLAVEIFKVARGLTPQIINEIFNLERK